MSLWIEWHECQEHIEHIIQFSKYEFYNKLLDGVTLLKVTPYVT